MKRGEYMNPYEPGKTPSWIEDFPNPGVHPGLDPGKSPFIPEKRPRQKPPTEKPKSPYLPAKRGES